MEPIYRVKFDVTNNDVDCFGRLKPSSILNMMQEAAGRQCVDLQVSSEALARRGLIWAITRQHIQIERLPTAGTLVTIETWPGETSRVAYPRSTIGYDQAGNVLFRAISLWVLMDMENRKMVLPGKSGIDFSGIERGGELAVPGSLAPAKLAGHQQRQVTYSELDINGHMSNTRYLDWMADLMPSAFHAEHPVREFTVTYLSEAREGEVVDLCYELSPEGQLRLEAIESGSGHRVFAVRANYC